MDDEIMPIDNMQQIQNKQESSPPNGPLAAIIKHEKNESETRLFLLLETNLLMKEELKKAKNKLELLRAERDLLLDKLQILNSDFSFDDNEEEEDDLCLITLQKRTFSSEKVIQEPIAATTPKSTKHTPKKPVAKKEQATPTSTTTKRHRIHPVPLDPDTGFPILPLTLGVITIHSLGRIDPERPAFHNKRYIYPIGYEVSRSYLSAIDPNSNAVYYCRIMDDGQGGPLFTVVASDNPNHPFSASSPSGVWSAIGKETSRIRGKSVTATSGPDYYGLSNPTIQYLIECLPNADKCAQYERKEWTIIGDQNDKKRKRTSLTNTQTESEPNIEISQPQSSPSNQLSSAAAVNPHNILNAPFMDPQTAVANPHPFFNSETSNLIHH